MKNRIAATLVAAAAAVTAGLGAAPPSRAADTSTTWTEARKRATAERVRNEFLHAWKSYRQYAWGHDELKPLSKQPQDWYGTSLMMTPVDALDTLILMGLKNEARDDRELIATHLSFDRDISVKGFEINIRLLGGLLSSYELTGDKRLLHLADDLGRRLLPLFDSTTGLPYVNVNLKTGAVSGVDTNPAEVGTYLLEFGALSKLTGKPIYYQKAKRAVTEMYNRRSPLGLVGSGINSQTGAVTNDVFHVGGGIDSYLEYLPKCYLLFGDRDCKEMWRYTLNAANQFSAEEAPSGFWYGPVNRNTGARLGHSFGALNAFFPGVLVLSGDLKRAAKLEASCYKMWTLEGIEPEGIDYANMTVISPGYPLRPEIIESDYYLYYYTHDPRYLDMGQTYLDSLIRYCRTDTAYAALNSVVTKEKADDMESFFFAETLKYLYLIFAPRDTLHLDRVVFNTEAHPIPRSAKFGSIFGFAR